MPEQHSSIESLDEYAAQMIDLFFKNKALFGISVRYQKYWPFFYDMMFDKNKEWIRLDWVRKLFPSVFKIVIRDCSFSEHILLDIFDNLKDAASFIRDFGLYTDWGEHERILRKYQNKFLKINFKLSYEYKPGYGFISGNIQPHYYHIQHIDYAPTSLSVFY